MATLFLLTLMELAGSILGVKLTLMEVAGPILGVKLTLMEVAGPILGVKLTLMEFAGPWLVRLISKIDQYMTLYQLLYRNYVLANE